MQLKKKYQIYFKNRAAKSYCWLLKKQIKEKITTSYRISDIVQCATPLSIKKYKLHQTLLKNLTTLMDGLMNKY